MALTFNSLSEAQAYALATGAVKYWRVWFDDQETREMRSRGGWWTSSRPAFRIYMGLEDAMDCISKRAAGTQERTAIETLWTADVSNSPSAK